MTDQPNPIDTPIKDHAQQISQDCPDMIKDQDQQTSQNHLNISQIATQVIADFQADLEYLRER